MTKKINHCQTVLKMECTTVRELSSLIGKLTVCMIAVVPAPLHYRHLQISDCQRPANEQGIRVTSVLESTKQGRDKLVDKLSKINERKMYQTEETGDSDQSTDASNKGWGAWTGPQKIGGF